MRVLALDCSSYVGWSFWPSADAVPKCGTWRMPKSWSNEAYGKRFVALHHWLADMLTRFEPEVLCWESPILPRAGMRDLKVTEDTLRTLVGLVSICELVAELREIRTFEVHVATAKKRLTGDARADKDAMLMAATRMGFPAADHHQADSCAVALAVFDVLEGANV